MWEKVNLYLFYKSKSILFKEFTAQIVQELRKFLLWFVKSVSQLQPHIQNKFENEKQELEWIVFELC